MDLTYKTAPWATNSKRLLVSTSRMCTARWMLLPDTTHKPTRPTPPSSRPGHSAGCRSSPRRLSHRSRGPTRPRYTRQSGRLVSTPVGVGDDGSLGIRLKGHIGEHTLGGDMIIPDPGSLAINAVTDAFSDTDASATETESVGRDCAQQDVQARVADPAYDASDPAPLENAISPDLGLSPVEPLENAISPDLGLSPVEPLENASARTLGSRRWTRRWRTRSARTSTCNSTSRWRTRRTLTPTTPAAARTSPPKAPITPIPTRGD